MHVPLSHPIHISELFIPNSQTATQIKFQYTEVGLAKLLLFSTFIRAQLQNETDYIATEAKKYPYTMKPKFQVTTICILFWVSLN